jgi:hypothetical protein
LTSRARSALWEKEERGETIASPLILLYVERETGFEPATSTLARLHSTTELFPPKPILDYQTPSLCQAKMRSQKPFCDQVAPDGFNGRPSQ